MLSAGHVVFNYCEVIISKLFALKSLSLFSLFHLCCSSLLDKSNSLILQNTREGSREWLVFVGQKHVYLALFRL